LCNLIFRRTDCSVSRPSQRDPSGKRARRFGIETEAKKFSFVYDKRVNDDKLEFNLEEELELLQKMAIILITKSGKASAMTKSIIPYKHIK
jgi:hypothetical protein